MNRVLRISGVLFAVISAVGVLAAPQDWQSLISNNPFGTSAAPAAPAATNGLEFRGVVQEDGVYHINLYDPTTKTAQWLPVKGSAPGVTVNNYDEQDGKVTVTHGGKQVELSMKQPTVTLMSPAMTMPGPNVANQQGRPTPGGVQFRQGGGPQFNRTLPPETQAMIEEIRRRRAQRQQAIQQGGANQQSGAQPAERGGGRRTNTENTRPSSR